LTGKVVGVRRVESVGDEGFDHGKGVLEDEERFFLI